MKFLNLKVPVMLGIFCVSVIAVAGDWNPVGSRDIPSKSCDPSTCPPGCCSAESSMSENTSIHWDRSQWKDLSYDQNGHLQKEMSKNQALNIMRQYLEKCQIDAVFDLTDTKVDVYRFAMQRTGTDFVTMLEVNRKNGWVRQIDGC